MANKSRDVVKIIFQNLWKSLQPRQIRGTYIGEDYFGNKFYEIAANPSIGKRKSSRWFEPKTKEDFEQEVTAEWEAWLRGRRLLLILRLKLFIKCNANILHKLKIHYF